MNQLPAEFQMYQVGKERGGVAPLFISQHEGVPFSFEMHDEVNAQKTLEVGVETMDTIEIVKFYNDPKNVAVHRITKKLFSYHPEILAEYERWKAGKASNITDLREWKAISPAEVGSCFRAGFMCVEQIVDASEERLHALGPDWKVIHTKAKAHKAKKEGIAESAKASTLVIELREEMRKRDEVHEAQMKSLMETFNAARSEPAIINDPSSVKKRGRPARELGEVEAA